MIPLVSTTFSGAVYEEIDNCLIGIWLQGITFTFANATITGTSPKFYEFDVMAQADVAGTKLGDNLIYINYNTLGFGTSVVSSGKVTVSKGSLLQGGSAPFFYYTITNFTDNTNSRMAITSEYTQPSFPEYGNDLSTTPNQLLHISIEIADDTQTAGLSFEPSLMTGKQYESDNSAKYDPVIASDTDDSSLPVELSNFSARFVDNRVQLNWVTESELDNLGFEILRSNSENDNYAVISSYADNEALEGSGNSSVQKTYAFVDNTLSEAGTYWYKLADVDYAGRRTEHEQVSVSLSVEDIKSISGGLPTAYQIYQNYPNPFNPTTTLSFDIPQQMRSGTVNLSVYDITGRRVRTLYQEAAVGGTYQITWDGRNTNGRLLASGIYYAVLKTTDFSKAIKMTLLK